MVAPLQTRICLQVLVAGRNQIVSIAQLRVETRVMATAIQPMVLVPPMISAVAKVAIILTPRILRIATQLTTVA